MNLYTIGYSNFESPAELAQVCDHLRAKLVDIRFRAWSRKLEFCGNRLQSALGSRYIQVPEMGNANYKDPSLKFRIADYFGGQDKIANIGQDVILMCTCKEILKCHRLLVAGRLSSLPQFSAGHTEIRNMQQILQPTLF